MGRRRVRRWGGLVIRSPSINNTSIQVLPLLRSAGPECLFGWKDLEDKELMLTFANVILQIITVMSSKECINKFSKNLFWDVDASQLQMNAHAAYIIQRVMEYGQMDDWRLINRYYGLDKIVQECQQLRTLDPVCLSFLCTISHTKPEQYRCYHFRQSTPTPWNSWIPSANALYVWRC